MLGCYYLIIAIQLLQLRLDYRDIIDLIRELLDRKSGNPDRGMRMWCQYANQTLHAMGLQHH